IGFSNPPFMSHRFPIDTYYNEVPNVIIETRRICRPIAESVEPQSIRYYNRRNPMTQ
ncbi:Hypothetical protein FKW44_020978, partial [Caligus rogercresseyi]